MSGSGKRGALIGLDAGGAAAAVFDGLLGRALGNDSSDVLTGVAILGGIGAGIGAAVRYGVGKIPLKRELIYEAA